MVNMSADSADCRMKSVESRRQDIQGLRAVAVIGVVVFHLDPAWMPGGYVGVDLFFVISGFLITGLLLREAQCTGQISLLRFWGRRARRLFPNATLTLAFVLVASGLLLPAYRQVIVAGDVVSAAALVSNFRFASQAVDYFATDVPPSPVLHFWSLSLEEQYYIIIPLLMFALTRLQLFRHYLWPIVLWSVFGLSLLYCIYLTPVSQPAAYFQTFSRAWQFALGGLLSLHLNRLNQLPDKLLSVLSIIGCLAVVVSFSTLRDTVDYPGLLALLPTVAAVLLLLCGSKVGLLKAALSTPLLGWIGDRSYSIYLWHWPVVVFLPTTSILYKLAELALIILLSEMAFRFVEQPIHKGAVLLSPKSIRLALLMVPLSIFIGAGALAALASKGRSEWDRRVSQARADMAPSYGDGCHQMDGRTEITHCLYGGKGPPVVLFGDSRAAQWLSAITVATEAKGGAVWSLTKSGCPTADIVVYHEQTRAFFRECNTWREAAIDAIIANRSAKVVLISENTRYFVMKDDETLCRQRGTCRSIWLHGFIKTIERLLGAGKMVVVIKDTPIARSDILDCLAGGKAEQCSRGLKDADIDIDFASVLTEHFGSRVSLIDLTDSLCPEDRCRVVQGDLLVYRDFEHLTSSFARTLWRNFLPVIPSQEFPSDGHFPRG
jgi:peptidoglycan/LPS O-acetylase OafA/YrhL